VVKLFLVNSLSILLQDTGQFLLFVRTRRAFEIQLPLSSRRSVRMILAIDQLPRAVLVQVIISLLGRYLWRSSQTDELGSRHAGLRTAFV